MKIVVKTDKIKKEHWKTLDNLRSVQFGTELLLAEVNTNIASESKQFR